ncbi:MAG: nuclear transport factor 2 family protein [Terriglobales bacterium]
MSVANSAANALADDEREIEELYEAGDAALMNADVEALSQILAEDYVQYGEAGQPMTRQQILDNFRIGAVRYPSIVSTGRTIRLLGEMAFVHGSELDEVECDGKRSRVRYMYLDVLMKREGKWKLVASQLARPFEAGE